MLEMKILSPQPRPVGDFDSSSSLRTTGLDFTNYFNFICFPSLLILWLLLPYHGEGKKEDKIAIIFLMEKIYKALLISTLLFGLSAPICHFE